MVDAGVGHDVGIDEDDVGHGDEGGQPGRQLGPDRRTMLAELEQAFEQAGGGRCRSVDPLFFLFGAFHQQVLLIALVVRSCGPVGYQIPDAARR
ncbi:hypothetical protein P4054_18345 [Pseudomonas aeruginosa]|nr:hypothetical protein [Pseudomonas aeruginosa]